MGLSRGWLISWIRTGVATLTIPTPAPMIARPGKVPYQSLTPEGRYQQKSLTSTPHANVNRKGVDKGTDENHNVCNDDAPAAAKLGRKPVANPWRDDGRDEEGCSVNAQQGTSRTFEETGNKG